VTEKDFIPTVILASQPRLRLYFMDLIIIGTLRFLIQSQILATGWLATAFAPHPESSCKVSNGGMDLSMFRREKIRDVGFWNWRIAPIP